MLCNLSAGYSQVTAFNWLLGRRHLNAETLFTSHHYQEAGSKVGIYNTAAWLLDDALGNEFSKVRSKYSAENSRQDLYFFYPAVVCLTDSNRRLYFSSSDLCDEGLLQEKNKENTGLSNDMSYDLTLQLRGVRATVGIVPPSQRQDERWWYAAT